MKPFTKAVLALVVSFLASCASTSTGPPLPGSSLKQGVQTADSNVDRSEAYKNYILGMLAERKGKYDQAIKLYSDATKADPALVQAYKRAATLSLRLGLIKNALAMAQKGLVADLNYIGCLEIAGGIYFSTGKYEKAIKYYNRIAQIDPEDQDTTLFLAVSYLKSGLHEDSIKTLEKFSKKFPERPIIPYFKGRAYIGMKDWQKAEKSFALLVRKYTSFLRGYENLAWVYRVRGSLDKAIEVYEKYLVLNPNDINIRSELEQTVQDKHSKTDQAELVSRLGENIPVDLNLNFRIGLGLWRQAEMGGDLDNFHKALDQFQLVRASNPENVPVIFYVANIFERIGLINEAIETWKRLAVHKGSQSRDVHLKIAELYERVGDVESSLKHALLAMEKDPEDPELSYFVGLIYNKLNKLKKAEKYFNEAIRLKPEEDKYYFYLGVVYEKMKKYDTCIEVMKKAIELKPDHSNALNYLGYIYAEQDINLKKAEKYLLKALRLEPDNGYFIDSLAWIYYKQGKYGKALEQILVAVRNIPPDPTVLEHLGDIYAALKHYHSAIKAYEHSLEAKADDGRKLDRKTTRKKIADIRKKTEEGKAK